MSMIFTDAFRIGTAGTSGDGFGLHNPNSTGVTVVIVPFRRTDGTTCDIYLQAGQLFPIKFREVKSSTLPLTGLV